MTEIRQVLSEVKDHSVVFWEMFSPPQRETFEAVERIGEVLCDLFVSIYERPVAVTYANARTEGPHAFAFSTYYRDDVLAERGLQDFFVLLNHVSQELSGTGLTVLSDSAILCAARLQDYVKLMTAFLACVRPPESRYFCVRALPDDLERLVLATDRARHFKKREDPFYSFLLN
ncbi:MAG TPA: hypothetical protein PKX87_05485 [Alphaproteobacteria bacterium]|nr:hypothetical protein [Alphaproteobacteria bacterium]